MKERFICNITTIREEKKMSRDKLAGIVGIVSSTLGRMENGQSDPKMSTLWRVARALDVTVDALFTRN